MAAAMQTFRRGGPTVAQSGRIGNRSGASIAQQGRDCGVAD
jgi:hypothetical protein